MNRIAISTRGSCRARLPGLLVLVLLAGCGDGKRETGGAPVAQSGGELVAGLGCAGCHPGLPASGHAREAAATANQLGSPAAIFEYLGEIPAGQPGQPRMPDFRLSTEERLAIARFMGTLRSAASGESAGARAYEKAVRDFPDADADRGQLLFAALNCAACHAQEIVPQWAAGPDLRSEGSRVRSEWLRSFLLDPRAVRPAGFQPGTGSRMPDFGLSTSEADSIAAYLMTLRAPAIADPRAERALSDREAEIAATFLRDRYSCLGCHQWNGSGGRIGPDLGNARDRLQPAFVHAMISNPQHTAPGSAMPRIQMPPAHVDLLARFILQADIDADASEAAVIDPVLPPVVGSPTSSSALYIRHCAACHGSGGAGDGFNAAYLDTRPAIHASADSMATRTDDRLYDGIHAGAFVLNGSPEMPPFGTLLTDSEIRGLVAYIRQLCRCAGPAWSRDGQRANPAGET